MPQDIEPSVAAAFLKKRCALRPSLGIVLGSGFEGVMGRMQIADEIPYPQVPGFPLVGVSGHAGRLVLGRLRGLPLLVLHGRAHYYEGHSMERIIFPIRVLAGFGIRALVLTNAAGGIARRLRVGDLMAFSDHLNLMGANPLRGPMLPEHPRFVDMTEAYDPELNALLKQAAAKAGLRLLTGVYAAVPGPSYETPAEIRALAALGADAVGMSTVPEVIVARQCGMRVAAVSCITNLAAGRSARPLSHSDVLAEAGQRKRDIGRWLEEFVVLVPTVK